VRRALDTWIIAAPGEELLELTPRGTSCARREPQCFRKMAMAGWPREDITGWPRKNRNVKMRRVKKTMKSDSPTRHYAPGVIINSAGDGLRERLSGLGRSAGIFRATAVRTDRKFTYPTLERERAARRPCAATRVMKADLRRDLQGLRRVVAEMEETCRPIEYAGTGAELRGRASPRVSLASTASWSIEESDALKRFFRDGDRFTDIGSSCSLASELFFALTFGVTKDSSRMRDLMSLSGGNLDRA